MSADRPFSLKTTHDEDNATYNGRQKALDAIQKTLVDMNACAACATSAAMYMAGMAARAIGWNKARFMTFAREVWENLDQQDKAEADGQN